MATIKGISLKSVKQFTGREGYGFSANVYLGSKKIGTAHDDASGGPMQIDISSDYTEQFGDIVKTYYDENPATYMGEDMFIEELLELNFREKEFKKNSKKGFPILVFVAYEKRNAPHEDFAKRDFSKQDFIVSVREMKDVQLVKEKHPAVEYIVYQSLEDFKIQ